MLSQHLSSTLLLIIPPAMTARPHLKDSRLASSATFTMFMPSPECDHKSKFLAKVQGETMSPLLAPIPLLPWNHLSTAATHSPVLVTPMGANGLVLRSPQF